jgi:hypothetical protein
VKDLADGRTVASISGLGTISGSSDLQIGGNITGSNALLRGDLAVNGGDITTSATTFNIAASAATVNVGSSTGVVVIPGDLEVQGTTMTVSASNLVIEDPLVGFGFLSGSVATSAGDRGFIGGITGAGNNVAFGWSNSNSAFVATRTTSSPENATIAVSALQPIRASKLEVNGTSAYVTSSNGTALTVFATDAATVQSNNDSVILSGSTVNNQATIAHKFNLGGTLISHVTASGGRQGFFPGADSTFDLGGPSIRWANIYTGDLHLRNERGSYTLIEESDFLSIRFNKNGKRYKFLLERVPELDES